MSGGYPELGESVGTSAHADGRMSLRSVATGRRCQPTAGFIFGTKPVLDLVCALAADAVHVVVEAMLAPVVTTRGAVVRTRRLTGI